MLNIIQNTIGAIRRVGESVVRAGLKMWLPFTKAEPLGENIVINGDFATDSVWQKGNGWTIEDGKGVATSVPSGQSLSQSSSIISGVSYKVTYTVLDFSEGGVYVRVGNLGYGITRTANGTYTETIEALGNSTIYFTAYSGSTTLKIDNVSIEEYAQETPDISGNDNNAILKTGKALVFAGNDSVETSFPSSKTIKTIAFWIYPTHSASQEVLFNLGMTNIPVPNMGNRVIELNHLTIRNRINYPLNFDVYIDGVYRGETNWNGDNPTLEENQWQRVVFVNSNGTSTVNDTFDIAYTGSGSHGRFKMSDLQIYGADWTTDDIAYDYANPQKLVTDNASSNVTLNDLHAWWHMSEGDGTIAFDSAPLIGSEVVTDNTFNDTNEWIKENGWVVSGGLATRTDVDSYTALQQNCLVSGETYTVTIVVDSVTSGNIFGVRLGTNYILQGGLSVGTHTATGTANGSVLSIMGNPDFAGSISSISIKEVFNIDGETYDGSSLGATYDDAQERIPQLGMMNWSKGSNVLTYSNDFSNSHWSVNGVNIDSGYIAPDGTATAYKVSQNGIGILFDANVSPNIGVTRSIWAKTVSGTGTVHLTSNFGNTNSIFTITNEWQRFSAISGSAAAVNFYAVDFRGSSTLTEVILWGAQEEVNVGDSLSAFRKTDGTAVTDATLISSATDSQKDILGNAVRVKGSGFNLDGTGYAEVLDDSAFDIPACNNVDEGGFTLSAWVKPKYVSKSSSINVVSTLGGDVTQPGTGGIVVFDTNKFGAYVNAAQLQADNTFIEGNWYYVVMTRGDNGICKLYVDTNEQSDTDYTLGSITNSNNKMVGRDSLPYQRFYEERIDDVKFYNRELSSDEIEQNYNATKSGHNN